MPSIAPQSDARLPEDQSRDSTTGDQPRGPSSLVDSIEIPCGLQVRAGVDDNQDGVLTDDEVITTVTICDKDQGPLQPPIIRWMPR